MAEELSCGLCGARYAEERMPLLLECGHTFCQECLMVAKTEGKTNCPICGKPNVVEDVNSLPKNYLVLQMALRGLLTRQASHSIDPWSCSLHNSQPLCFYAPGNRKFYCSECYKSLNPAGLVAVDRTQMRAHLEQFRELYEQSNPEDLECRRDVMRKLGIALEGHKYAALDSINNLYQLKRVQIETHHRTRLSELDSYFSTQITALSSAKTILAQFKESKQCGTPFASLPSSLPVSKHQALLQALIGYEERDSITLSQVIFKELDATIDYSIPKSQLDLTNNVVRLSHKVLKEPGVSEPETQEYTVRRFDSLGKRWGLFNDRNQVEAVSFVVDKTVVLKGVGIGNSFEMGSKAVCEDLKVVKGTSSKGDIVLVHLQQIEMENFSTQPSVFRVDFPTPVQLDAKTDYTLRAVLKGEAGVHRGGDSSKVVRVAPLDVTVVFKKAEYHHDDVENGNNLIDGPLLELHISPSVPKDIQMSRFASIAGDWSYSTPGQVEAVSFSVSKACQLSALGLCSSLVESDPVRVTLVEVMEGQGTRGTVVVYRREGDVGIGGSGKKEFRMDLDRVVDLNAETVYTVRVKIAGHAGSYCGEDYVGPIVLHQSFAVTFVPSLYEGDDSSHSNSSTSGPIVSLFLVPTRRKKGFALGQAPSDLVPQLGGEFKVKRFRGTAEGWHINNDSQVESFTFVLTKTVIATAVGVGCPVSRRKQVRVKSLQIILGPSTGGPVVYSSESDTMIACGDWDKKVARIPLSQPVRLEANTPYTLRLIIRGDSKVFKGTGLLPNPLSLEDGCFMTIHRSEMTPPEVRNGENEIDGPIFYLSYMFPGPLPSLEDVKAVELKLFPIGSDTNKEEIKVQRFERFGGKWYVKDNGKQVEAISIAVDKPVFLTALGLGNAAKLGHKATILDLKVLVGHSTASPPLYTHGKKEKLLNTGDDSLVIKLPLSHKVQLEAETFYTIRVQYKPGSRVVEGKGATNEYEEEGVRFHFEGANFEDGDEENGSHEAYGPLVDFYFVEDEETE